MSNLETQSFAFYETALADVNQAHPQRQGLVADEFGDALRNPQVTRTSLRSESGTIQIPQLAPVNQFSWLNDEYYQRHFPQEFAAGTLMHFTDVPGVSPGAEVNARLQELADRNGVLAYDYPSVDPDYAARLGSHLSSLGISITQEDELAKQTYFAGEVSLDRERPRRDPALWLPDAYDELVADGSYDQRRIKNGASLMRLVKRDQAEKMNAFYEAAYEVLSDEPCKQGLSPEEFLHMMTEDENVAKIVNTVDGTIASLLLLENKLESLSWVNPQYYKDRYPAKYANGQIVWFPGLAADPNNAASFNTQIMVDLIGEVAERADNEMVVVFDCGKRNTGFLDTFLNTMINETPQGSIDIQPIASQTYQAVRLQSDK